MSSYSVKKPITVLMGILIIIVLGLFSVIKLPLTLFPDINLPYVITVTAYPGASPETIETDISIPIEGAVSTIGFFEEVESMSNENFALSIITFQSGADMDTVVIEMRELIDNLAFPEGVTSPRILRISPDLLPVMTITLSRSHSASMTDAEALIADTEWITRDVLNDLKSIPGVADVTLSGTAEIAIELNLDQTLLGTTGLSEFEVLNIIEEQSEEGLIGVVLDQGTLRMLYLGDSPSLLQDLRDLPVTVVAGEILRLSDLTGEDGIRFVNTNTESYSKINGTQGIQISFQKQSDVGITEVTDAIHERLAEIVEDSPYDVSYDALFDQGQYINMSLTAVVQNMVIGGLLAVIILFLFLRDLKPTLIVALAIPISVVAAFMLMDFSGVTLNLVSMGGLALGVGMLVDNAVVVIENIYRMIDEGTSRVKAAIDGAKQVGGAITASTLTTAAVFLPIVFIEGLVAEVFLSMALTIAFALGASLLIALTLVPAMASRMLPERREAKESKLLLKAKNAYERSVTFALRHKIKTLLLILALLLLSAVGVIERGFVMLPETDEGFIDVTVSFESSVPFSARSAYADLVSEAILTIDDVDDVFAAIGGGSFMGPGMLAGMGNDGLTLSVSLKLDRKSTTIEATKAIEEILSAVDYETISDLESNQVLDVSVTAQNSAGQLFGGQGIEIKVSGYDLEVLEEISNTLVGILEDTEGVINVDGGIQKGEDVVRLTVNQDNAIRLGLTNADVTKNITFMYQNLESLATSETINLMIEGVTYPVQLPQSLTIGDPALLAGITYDQFISGIMLFDDDVRTMIEAYIKSTGNSIYVDAMTYAQMTGSLPLDGSGKIRLFVVNPNLNIFSGQINEGGLGVSLVSRSLSYLLTTNPETTVADAELATGFLSINTDGTSRFLTVTGQIESDLNITLVSSDVIKRVNTYLESDAFTSLGGGYAVTFEGENEEIMQAVSDLSIAAMVSVLLVYMVMAIQFQSLLYPLIILGTIPLAFTGGLIALFVTGANISLVSLMGFIILIGIVVNNGIVLIDYINKLREQGMPVTEALVEAGRTRLRPIFMTALTTILALSTLAMGFGQGSELLQPMAATAIGGLLYATLLTLVVIPVIYALMNRKTIREEARIKDQNE